MAGTTHRRHAVARLSPRGPGPPSPSRSHPVSFSQCVLEFRESGLPGKPGGAAITAPPGPLLSLSFVAQPPFSLLMLAVAGWVENLSLVMIFSGLKKGASAPFWFYYFLVCLIAGQLLFAVSKSLVHSRDLTLDTLIISILIESRDA